MSEIERLLGDLSQAQAQINSVQSAAESKEKEILRDRQKSFLEDEPEGTPQEQSFAQAKRRALKEGK